MAATRTAVVLAVMVLAVTLLAGCTHAKPADADPAYLDYLAEFKIGAVLERSGQRGEDTFNVGLRLRTLDTRTTFYRPYTDPSDKASRAAGAHRASGRHAERVKAAEDALAINYTNLGAHFLAARCSVALGDGALTRQMVTPFLLLIEAVLSEPGRDGKTSETSWRAISVAEQHVILGHLGLATTSKSLLADNKGEMSDCHAIRPNQATLTSPRPSAST